MDNLIQVMNYLCSEFSYTNDVGVGRLTFTHDSRTNRLKMMFLDSMDDSKEFMFTDDTEEFLKFLNQEISPLNLNILEHQTVDIKIFDEVWSRDRLHFHASFSTSRRHFIGKRDDFYQNLTLLYPPSNETTFNVRFTSDGYKNILLRYCEFDIQLCFIVNYLKNVVL